MEEGRQKEILTYAKENLGRGKEVKDWNGIMTSRRDAEKEKWEREK